MSALHPVVVGAGGVRIAQRHATAGASEADLRVGPVAPVALPEHAALEAQAAGGVVWRRHWEEGARLVIDFVDIAVVAVDGFGVVTFDRALPDEVEQHLLLDHVLPLVLARRGALVVHGAVISRERMGVVLLGSSGAGKSTLATFAGQHGWTVGGDDGAVLTTGPPPRAEPTYPTVRLTEESVALLGIEPDAGSPVMGKLRLADQTLPPFSSGPVALGVIVVVTPDETGDAARLERLEGVDAHAELFGFTFHADLRTPRLLPTIVDDLAQIVDATLVGRLVVPRGRAGLEEAEGVLLDELHAATEAQRWDT